MRSWLTQFAVALLGSATFSVAQQVGIPTQFSVGLLKRVDELPAGRFRDQLEKLPLTAKGRAIQWLRSIHLPAADVASLHADHGGGIFYCCHFSHSGTVGTTGMPTEPPVTGQAALPVSPFPSQLVFNSRPGAQNVIFLNFQGESVTGTAWNTSLGRSVIPAVAFSTDSDASTFSDSEQSAIKRVWQRVSEDFALFDVNVTTARPSSFTTRTAMALITRSSDADGAANPSNGGGGVAYINVSATSSFATYRPAWIYFDNLANIESYIAEAVSHEIGHNLGLSRDGTSAQDYYGGHGSGEISRGPIMGTGYNQNVSQWSKGEYPQANNTQDDLAVIAGKVSYRTDDHGSTRAGATPLVVSGGTSIVPRRLRMIPLTSTRQTKGCLSGART